MRKKYQISNIKYQMSKVVLAYKRKSLDIGRPRKCGIPLLREILDIGYSSKGYTLVELLAVIVVLTAIGGIMAGIFFGTLRGSNKTNAITVVRQNGDYAMSQMTRAIRGAKSFDGISTSENGTYTTDCSVSAVSGGTPTPTPIEYMYMKLTSFDGGQTNYACITTDPATVASISGSVTQSLLDTTSVSVVSGTCYFTCSQSNPTDIPTIGISFTLKQQSASTFAENQAQLQFKTTVSPRNRIR